MEIYRYCHKGGKIKILLEIGSAARNTKVSIPFQEKELSNNHILLKGISGSGKTYLLQKMIIQAAKQGISTVILDYSGSYSTVLQHPYRGHIFWIVGHSHITAS